MFVIDTDALSGLRKARQDPALRAWIARTPVADLTTTVVTITEIQCGIERQRAANPDYARGTQAWLDGMLMARRVHIHALDVPAALLLGRMHETPALRNFVVQDPGQKRAKTAGDLAIAAIAIAQGAAIATGNHVHFQEINAHFPLPGLYNPFRNAWIVPHGDAVA